MTSKLTTISHKADLCVVGGGIAGMCTAMAAARNGTRVVLVHDRPVFGGNASEEIRMWICGAFGANMRETGIIEEIELENIYRNPYKNYSIWSSVLHDHIKREPNIVALLNASVLDAETSAESTNEETIITSVTAWQLTTQRFHRVEATLFADCSGDSILAPLTGAETRWGRESQDEFGEPHAEAEADGKTMGMSCLIQPKEKKTAREFVPPWFAHRYTRDDVGPGRFLEIGRSNYWWLEAGGDKDTIHDTEELRDDLLGIATGVWDLVKRNSQEYDSENWDLEWMGFLPGKRESRRYVGDHIITQHDVEAGGPFEDVVAYAGWSMDNHAPAGFYDPGNPTIYHPAPSPWGIPYRSLYSKNVVNLLCAGRNISASHVALSSSRVMRTCATIGQAAGTAAAVAIAHATNPRGVYEHHLEELQQTLLYDDAYLPGVTRRPTEVTARAGLAASNEGTTYTVSLCRTDYGENPLVFSSGLKAGQHTKFEWYKTNNIAEPDVLRNGVDRTVEEEDNGFWCEPGDTVTYTLADPTTLKSARLVFDSDLSRYYRDHRMKCYYPLDDEATPVAERLVKAFSLEAKRGGRWETIAEVKDNRQRLVRVDLSAAGEVTAVRLTPKETWGADLVHLFAFDLA